MLHSQTQGTEYNFINQLQVKIRLFFFYNFSSVTYTINKKKKIIKK